MSEMDPPHDPTVIRHKTKRVPRFLTSHHNVATAVSVYKHWRCTEIGFWARFLRARQPPLVEQTGIVGCIPIKHLPLPPDNTCFEIDGENRVAIAVTRV